MPRPRIFLSLAALGLLVVGGCVAYPVDGYYGGHSAVYAPPPVYFGGSFGGYRPHQGHHRGWRNKHWR